MGRRGDTGKQRHNAGSIAEH
jgi:hypothetical protein